MHLAAMQADDDAALREARPSHCKSLEDTNRIGLIRAVAHRRLEDAPADVAAAGAPPGGGLIMRGIAASDDLLITCMCTLLDSSASGGHFPRHTDGDWVTRVTLPFAAI
jgi:hypothetical protein